MQWLHFFGKHRFFVFETVFSTDIFNFEIAIFRIIARRFVCCQSCPKSVSPQMSAHAGMAAAFGLYRTKRRAPLGAPPLMVTV